MERTYKFTIGKPVSTTGVTNISDFLGDPKNQTAYLIEAKVGDYSPANLSFQITKNTSKEPNKGSITVCNLSDDLVNYLEQNADNNLACVLEVGFDGINTQVFAGTVDFIEDTFNEHTRETKFELGDASLNIRTSSTSRSYAKGTNYNSVVSDLLSDLRLPIGRFDKSSGVLPYSMSFTGKAITSLSKVADICGCNFSVQDGSAYWVDNNKSSSTALFEISEDSGMKGSPKILNTNKKKKNKKKKEEDKDSEEAGLEVTCALNGAILPEMVIYLVSKKYTGFYKVLEVNHNGEYETQGAWDSTLQLIQASGRLT